RTYGDALGTCQAAGAMRLRSAEELLAQHRLGAALAARVSSLDGGVRSARLMSWVDMAGLDRASLDADPVALADPQDDSVSHASLEEVRHKLDADLDVLLSDPGSVGLSIDEAAALARELSAERAGLEDGLSVACV